MRDTERGSDDEAQVGREPGENADGNAEASDERGEQGCERDEHGERRTTASDALEAVSGTDPEATIDRAGTTGFEEVYVVPEPDPESARYRVFVLTAEGCMHHVGTFDLAALKRSDEGLPAAAIGAATGE